MSAHRGTIQLIMQEIGPQAAMIDAVVQHGADSWAIQLNDGALVLLEYADNPERLVFSTDLGMPIPQRRLEVCQLMLSYNLLWEENTGLTMALGGPEGSAMLLFDWRSERPQLDALRQALDRFAQVAGAWRSYVAQTETSGSESLSALPGLSGFA